MPCSTSREGIWERNVGRSVDDGEADRKGFTSLVRLTIPKAARQGMEGGLGQRELGIRWKILAEAVVELHGDVEAAVTTIWERAEDSASNSAHPYPDGNGSTSDTNG